MVDSYFGLVVAFFGLAGIYYMITYFSHIPASNFDSKLNQDNSLTPTIILNEYRNSKEKKETMDKYKDKFLNFPCKFHSVKEAEEGLLEVVFLFGPELISCSIQTKKYPFLLKSNAMSSFIFKGAVQKITNESIRMVEKQLEKI